MTDEDTNRPPNLTGAGVASGAGVGAALFAATDSPVWIGVGAAISAAIGAGPRIAAARQHHRPGKPPMSGGNVSGMRYRCNLGPWLVAASMVLPYAVITLLGPAFIAVSQAFAG